MQRQRRNPMRWRIVWLLWSCGCGARSGLLFDVNGTEVCGNGLDDDGNGLVDEACPCPPGMTQECYSGPAGTEGVGICVAGVQQCDPVEETMEWSSCSGEIVPATEACVAGVDDDCDGLVDCDDPDCAAAQPCEKDPGDCTPNCPFEECDGRDNNGDGRTDEGRVCDGIEGPCPAPGAVRICDAYCGVHQRCRVDGSWGPCIVDGQGPVPECDEHADCAFGSICDMGGCLQSMRCESDDDCDPYYVDGFCAVEQGVCVIECFHHSDCPLPLVCDLGACIADPYAP